MKVLLYIATLIFVLGSCQDEGSGVSSYKNRTSGFKDSLQNINRVLIKKDKERIEAYINRMGWKMEESGTGLRYAVIENRGEEKAKDGSRVEIDYQIELLDGTLAYSSEEDGTGRIIIGKTEAEAGLQEGLKLLGTGDSAVFIVPPYLAKGLLGDFEKIPARSILVYKLRIKDIENF